MHPAGGGTRTRTSLSGQGILSPLRLPFRHAGCSGNDEITIVDVENPALVQNDVQGRKLRSLLPPRSAEATPVIPLNIRGSLLTKFFHSDLLRVRLRLRRLPRGAMRRTTKSNIGQRVLGGAPKITSSKQVVLGLCSRPASGPSKHRRHEQEFPTNSP
jgi:hypothetical protein